MTDQDPALHPGAAPGQLASLEDRARTRFDLMAYDLDHLHEEHGIRVEEVSRHLASGQTVWVSVTGTASTDEIAALGQLAGMHALALEDVVNLGQRAKCELFGDAVFVVLPTFTFDPEGEGLERHQFAIFARDGLVLTFEEQASRVCDPVRRRVARGRPRLRNGGAGYLTYALIDSIVDHLLPVAEHLHDEVDRLEERVDRGDTAGIETEIHRIRRRFSRLRREVVPAQEVLSSARRSELLFEPEVLIHLRDVSDHLSRLVDLVDHGREVANALMDLHLANIGSRTNDTMRILTIISTIFIPMSIVTGVYGMNFDPGQSAFNMPELGWRFGYPFALALMAAIGGVMLVWFRRRGWI